MHDLTTAEGTLAYLASTTFASSSAVKLSGGNTNFLYRCHLETPFQGRKTVTVKHSKPYLMNETFFAGSRQVNQYHSESSKLTECLNYFRCTDL